MIGQLCAEPAESLNQPQRLAGSLGEWVEQSVGWLGVFQCAAGGRRAEALAVGGCSLWDYVGTSGDIR